MLDSDNDGLPDAFELAVSHSGTNTFTTLWLDGQGTPDAWYMQYNLNPNLSTADADADGLSNAQEYRWGADPRSAQPFGIWISSPQGAIP